MKFSLYNKQTKLLLLYFVNHLFYIFEDSRYPYRYEIMDAAASKLIYRLGDCKKIVIIIFVVKVALTQTSVKLWFTTPNFANWQIFTEQIFTVASVTINSVKLHSVNIFTCMVVVSLWEMLCNIQAMAWSASTAPTLT